MISAKLIRELERKGFSVAQIADFADAIHAARAEQRSRDAARKRKERARPKCPSDNADISDRPRATQPLAPHMSSDLNVCDSTQQSEAAVSGQKEIPPTPPKEKLPTSPESPSDDLFLKEARGSGVTRARAKVVATRLPDDWLPALDDRAFALTLLRADQVATEIEKFRDYWHARAGPEALSPRWSARWRNWCRKAVEINGNGKDRHNSYRGDRRGTGFAAYALRLVREAG
jgi:hypothetical protein